MILLAAASTRLIGQVHVDLAVDPQLDYGYRCNVERGRHWQALTSRPNTRGQAHGNSSTATGKQRRGSDLAQKRLEFVVLGIIGGYLGRQDPKIRAKRTGHRVQVGHDQRNRVETKIRNDEAFKIRLVGNGDDTNIRLDVLKSDDLKGVDHGHDVFHDLKQHKQERFIIELVVASPEQVLL